MMLSQARGEVGLPALYRSMYRSRHFEDLVSIFWEAGLITGEMHTGHGEEAIAAGVVHHLGPEDSMALDYRPTPPLLMRGVSPESLLREFLGQEGGLCGGAGGHMHLFSRDHLAASYGIVGSSGPAGLGFALSAERLRPGAVAVAFFGEGAANQGMLLESMNLAAVWSLPLLFVCKDDGVAVTTHSAGVTAGGLAARASAFELSVRQVDGIDVEAVWQAAGELISNARSGQGPGWLYARCAHLKGHMLGDPLRRAVMSPLRDALPLFWDIIQSALHPMGAPIRSRLAALRELTSRIPRRSDDSAALPMDPIPRARRALIERGLAVGEIEEDVQREMGDLTARILREIEEGG